MPEIVTEDFKINRNNKYAKEFRLFFFAIEIEIEIKIKIKNKIKQYLHLHLPYSKYAYYNPKKQ